MYYETYFVFNLGTNNTHRYTLDVFYIQDIVYHLLRYKS